MSNPHVTKSTKSILKHISTRSAIVTGDLIETWVVIPPDGGWGWFIVLISFLSYFLIDGAAYTFGLFLEDIGASFDVHPTKVALSSSVMNGLYYFTGPISCALINRFGFRIVAMTGGFVSALTFLCASFVNSLTAFILIHGIFGGIGFNLVYSPCILIVGFYFERWRALATAVSVTGTACGVIGFPILISRVMGHLNWRSKFRIFGGLFATIIFMALAFRPIKPTRVLEEKKTFSAIYEIDDDEDASIGTCDIAVKEEGEERGFFSRLYNRFHNLIFPTVAELAVEPELLELGEEAPDIEGSIFLRQFSEGGFMPAGSICLSGGGPGTTNNASVLYEETQNNNEKKEKKCCQCCKGMTEDFMNRPLYQDDIFFAGSVWQLPVYQKSISVLSKAGPSKAAYYESASLGYNLAVTRTLTRADIEESTKCVCCPESIVRILVTMMDFRLFKNKAFILLTLSGFLTNTGMYLPYIFIPQWCSEIGLTSSSSTMLLMVIGISNALGRILCGLISSIPKIDKLVVSWVTTLITGSNVIASFFLHNLEGQIVCAILFGVNIASFTALRSVVIAEMMGLENLTNAFGITIMFYGFGCFLGPIAAGAIQNASRTYGFIFIFAGLLILLSAVLLMPLPAMVRAEKKKKKVKFSGAKH